MHYSHVKGQVGDLTKLVQHGLSQKQRLAAFPRVCVYIYAALCQSSFASSGTMIINVIHGHAP